MFEALLFDARIVEITADNQLVLDYQGSIRTVRLTKDQQLTPGETGNALCLDDELRPDLYRVQRRSHDRWIHDR